MAKVIVENNFDELHFLKQAENFQLVYLFSDQPIEFESKNIIEVDKKITFKKDVSDAFNDAGIQIYSGLLTDNLLQLAFQSGEYSRFKTDPRLSGEEFKSLYKIWISKALTTRSLLVTEDQSGMITFTISGEYLNIGLIAVEQHGRGKGIGKKLMRAVEQKAVELGIKYIVVPTQENNISACKFYQSLGYLEVEKTYVYHWWRQ